MKIKIGDYKEDAVSKMYLWLEPHGDNVRLVGRDGNGQRWIIAEIGEDGIIMAGCIARDSGWPLDDRGKLVVK